MKRFALLFLVLLPACVAPIRAGEADRRDAARINDANRLIMDFRAAAQGEIRPGGLRAWLGPSALENPRRLLPNFSDTAFARKLSAYAPFAPTNEDRAAAALGIWIAENADTILSTAPTVWEEGERAALVWPGTRLPLKCYGSHFHIVGAETAPRLRRPERPAPRGERITVVFTNDIHGALLPFEAFWVRREPRPMAGGMASVATYVRTARTVAAAMGTPVLLLDAGDCYQGTPEGTISKGWAMVPVLNALDYDAIEIGNHDYDHGRTNAEALVGHLEAPVLGANIFDTATGRIEAGLQREVFWEGAGTRVGITGVLTTTMPTLTFARNIAGLEFRSETVTLGEIMPELRAQGAKLTIALNHVGFDGDTAIARAVPGIDLIVGGHSHTVVDTAWVGPNGTIVVQTGGKGSAVGRIDLVVKPEGGIETFAYRHVSLYLDQFPEDNRMKETIRSATGDVGREMARVLGTAETDVTPSYNNESRMGRLSTDLLREWAHADVAVLAGGGIRGGFSAGPVRVRDCFQVFPFGNPLAVADVPGAVLARVFEHGVSTPRGSIQVSGAALRADTSLPVGSRLVEARVGGEILDPARTYRVVTDAFLAQGGSGYFANEKIAWELHYELSAYELLRDHVERAGVVRPPLEARITFRR